MRISLIILILAATGFFSCNQADKQTSGINAIKNADSVKDIEHRKTFNNKDIYTRYAYTDPDGRSLVIQNGFPRGGVKYTDPKGKHYNYAVFWTQIINETDSPLELKMNVPEDFYGIPSLPGKYYQVLIPADTMTFEKFPLPIYGLKNLDPFLDKNVHKAASLRRIIHPKELDGFYVVILCLTEGAHGTMRTELSLKGQSLFYRIKVDGSKSNSESGDQEVHCGNINLKDLVLQG